MKFSCSIIINQPIDKVVDLFLDPSNLKEYQEGFDRKELISGEGGKAGAVSKMYYTNNVGELTETIIANNLPDEFMASYHHKHMDNTMKSSFIVLGDKQTKYETEIEYLAFRGLMIKIMAFLFPSLFKKQVDAWLNNFKEFAERG